MSLLPRSNNPEELRAFERSCAQLQGFAAHLGFEWVDGYLAGLAAGPGLPDDWLQTMCGDAFERAFADPQARRQALSALRTRLVVLQDQLDAEALLDQPDELRLQPLMALWTEEDGRRIAAEDGLSAEEALAYRTGHVWAEGFIEAARAAALRAQDVQPDDEAASLFADLLRHVGALTLQPGTPDWQQHLADFPPQDDAEPDRETLIDSACFAAQDLRLWWVDQAARPQTRRLAAKAGRNDPCPCGSGKKFKKCHGAAGAAPQA